MQCRKTTGLVLAFCLCALSAHAAENTFRLYDGVNAFVSNPDGRAFTVTLDVRDCNYRSVCPSEMLVKIYPPDGRPVVRTVVPDDGVPGGAYAPPMAGWDQEAWYYATCYSRGIEPMTRWSAFSDPKRLAATPKRTFTYPIEGGQKGVYRVVLVGNPDLYVTVSVDAELPVGYSASPEWTYGHGDQWRESYIYCPRGTSLVRGLFLQNDRPSRRRFTLTDAEGNELMSGSGAEGFVRRSYAAPEPGALDEKILTLRVSEGPGDFIIGVGLQMAGKVGAKDDPAVLTLENFDDIQPMRGPEAVAAVLCPDAGTARAIQNGAIYHDGHRFWQMYQVRLYDWLKTLAPEDFEYPADLPEKPRYVSPGSHLSPKAARMVQTWGPQPPGFGDVILHSYDLHKNPQALNAAIRDTFYGARIIGPGDHVALGPLRNLAYDMGCYGYFYTRPTWRIIQQTDAPDEVKDALRELAVQVGDRLAFVRGMGMVNGNAFASAVAALRYCQAATDDPMLKELFDTFFERFTTGGFGDRIGQGPSGGIQESFGYDFHYGSYVLRGWRTVNADIADPRMIASLDRVRELYSYVYSPVGAAPQNSRTSNRDMAVGPGSWSWRFPWKGDPGHDLTESVLGANAWFAARRSNYYVTTYHGRLTPTWMNEAFQGIVGLGGGAICQVVVPGEGGGTVISSYVNGSYGKGMAADEWRNFHVHGIVGETTDGKPLVGASSEHLDARLDGTTVTSSGEIRQSSVRTRREYTFGPQSIACSVELAPSVADQAYGLWGGRPHLRGRVRECYEMIPFEDPVPPKRRNAPEPERTKVAVLDAAGQPTTVIGEAPVQAQTILVGRTGFGCVIALDELRPVMRGKNNTLLVRLADQPTPVGGIRLSYTITPYLGEVPEPGAVITGPEPLQAALLPAIDEVVQVAEALEDCEPVVVKAGEAEAARIRFAVAGDALALHALMVDAAPTQMPRPWEGSCLEVFGSMPGKAEIGQVFLLPEAGGKPAVTFVNRDGKWPRTDAIDLVSVPRPDGYELVALIPLELLQLRADAGEITVEFQASCVRGRKADGTPDTVTTTAFGSRLAYQDCSRYAVCRLAEPGADPEE